MAPDPQHVPPIAYGYVRVSTRKQESSGLGLEAQEAALIAEAEAKGWDLRITVEIASGKSVKNRPKLLALLDQLDKGQGDVLVIAKHDRAARDLGDFIELRKRSESGRHRWAIRALDLDIDTSTAEGELMANTLLSFAQFERRKIAERTKASLAAKRARGDQLGRKVSADLQPVYRRIIAERAAGRSLPAIAASLNDEGVPTARGATWHPSTIAAVLSSQAAAKLAEQS